MHTCDLIDSSHLDLGCFAKTMKLTKSTLLLPSGLLR